MNDDIWKSVTQFYWGVEWLGNDGRRLIEQYGSRDQAINAIRTSDSSGARLVRKARITTISTWSVFL